MILLDNFANLDLAFANGMTPLHLAAGVGAPGIVELLLARGASSAIQDDNGAWPFELAERRKFTNVSSRLRSQLNLDVADFETFLQDRGYIAPGMFFDPARRQMAVRMFQQGGTLRPTGYIDQETMQRALHYLKVNIGFSYFYVFRYEKNKKFWVGDDKSYFTTATAAREAATAACRENSGQNCKIDIVPPGGCLAIAAPRAGPFRVSAVMLTRGDASADALAKCAGDPFGGCSIHKILCFDPRY